MTHARAHASDARCLPDEMERVTGGDSHTVAPNAARGDLALNQPLRRAPVHAVVAERGVLPNVGSGRGSVCLRW